MLGSMILQQAPLHFGPISAWGPIITVVGLLAMTEYFRRTFKTREAADKDREEIERLVDSLKEDIANLDAHLRSGNAQAETRLVTRHEFNGLGERHNRMHVELEKLTVEVRSAVALSTQASADVRHLGQRMEDVIAAPLRTLSERVEQIYKWKLYEHRNDPPGAPKS